MNKEQIENIIWHIKTNRRVLDEVLSLLKNSVEELNQKE